MTINIEIHIYTLTVTTDIKFVYKSIKKYYFNILDIKENTLAQWTLNKEVHCSHYITVRRSQYPQLNMFYVVRRFVREFKFRKIEPLRTQRSRDLIFTNRCLVCSPTIRNRRTHTKLCKKTQGIINSQTLNY